ncbi:CoA transferase [Aeromicrobium sp. CF4.19]|uniref:CoA transferase n=1 Tax=Aeromicrobium sp. CF4.19 TaxID=3373082 RepID=UPI003EE42A1B
MCTSTRARGASLSAEPLSGLRVFEVSTFVAAPLGGMTLAQMGADVIRVDPIGGAADRQRWPLAESGTSMYWAGLNKGKRSVTADFRSEQGRAIVRDLVAACETGTAVVLTNAVGRDWLSYEALSEVCPDLIHVQVQGRSDGAPAVDYTVNAEVGFPMVTGPAGHADPINHVLPAWDIACGLYAALGVVTADRRRVHTGEGERVTVALQDVALAMAGNLGFLAEAQVNQVDRTRIGNYLYGGFARDFSCSDGGRLMVVALTARHWDDLLEVTDMRAPVEALESSLVVSFRREDDRFEYREVLAGLFQRWFAGRTTAEATEALSPTSLVWSQYRTFGEAIHDLQDRPNPLMSVIDQPGVGRHLAPSSPLRLTSVEHDAVPAPRIGADTDSVLADVLGLDRATRTQLHDDRVVGH